MRRGPTLRATPSLRLSLAAKPNDTSTLIFHTKDSVTFSTARYRFDINRIATVTPQREVISGATRCILDKHIQGGLTELSYPMSF